MREIELLRKAADALGWTYNHPWNKWREENGNKAGLVVRNAKNKLVHTAWNPLDDDGPALRLAVALGIRVEYSPLVCATTPAGHQFFGVHGGPGRLEQVRYAIVRAAADVAGEARTSNNKSREQTK